MPYRDLRPVWLVAARAILPAVCGAVGAMLAMVAPLYYNAFCGIG